ncbi:MAG: AMP-binding protein [Desulfatibacillaceae bacterium]|nr:AMP-binding protein [Desulfatibacillaceae bacterium]
MRYEDRPWLANYDDTVLPDVKIPKNISFADLLEKGVGAFPERPGMYFMGVAVSFGQLMDMSSSIGAFMQENGMGPGDVIGIHLPNIPQYLITLLASMRAGTASTGVSALLTPKELAYQINDSGAKALVTLDFLFEQKLLPVSDQVPDLKFVLVANVADFLPAYKRILGKLLKKVPTGKVMPISGKKVVNFSDVLKKYPARIEKPSLTQDDAALIQYTGGTTGLPKGVVLTHGNLVANYCQVNAWTQFTPGKDVFCSGFPFFHQAGQIFGLAAMVTSNPQCLIPDPRDTNLICNMIETHKVTVMANVPTLYHMLMDNPRFKTLDFSNLRVCVSGAAPFSEKGINAMEEIVGKGKVLEVYGMTETSPLITGNPYRGQSRIGSVGLPLPNTKVRVVDTEDRTKEVPPGQEGELAVSGPQVMARYHNKPEETDHAVWNIGGERWLFTGDVVRMDEDGFFFIVDRAKDMLNVGGYKVFSREVEEGLYKVPEVEFCAIVGEKNPDRPGSEIVKAVIQLKESAKSKDPKALEEKILAFCKETMAPYKIPKKIEFTNAMPLTVVGKVDKKQLR